MDLLALCCGELLEHGLHSWAQGRVPPIPSHARYSVRHLCLRGRLSMRSMAEAVMQSPRSVLERRARVVGALEDRITLSGSLDRLLSPPRVYPTASPRSECCDDGS